MTVTRACESDVNVGTAGLSFPNPNGPPMIFAGCQSTHSSPSRITVSCGGDALAVRAASHRLGSYSPRLDRDLADLGPRDEGEWAAGTGFSEKIGADQRVACLDSGTGGYLQDSLTLAFPDLRVVVVSAGLGVARRWGERFGRGRVWAVGARSYTKAERDEMRNHQRLLPLFEVGLEVAARTTASECEDFPLFISVQLDVLDAAFLPGPQPPAPGGATLENLREALAVLPGRNIRGFEVAGWGDERDAKGIAALTAAELLRDNILTWW